MLSRRRLLNGVATLSAVLTGAVVAGTAGAQQASGGRPAPSPAAPPAPPAPPPPKGPRILSVGTGRVTGIYFPVGGAICRVLNRDSGVHGLRCLVEPTEGSIANVKALRAGALDLALVQSDWQAAALAGTGPFEGTGAFGELRSLAALHGDVVTVLVRHDLPLQHFGELKGRRVNLGPGGSSLRLMAERVIAAHGLGVKDFKQVTDHAPDRQVEALCEGQIDAAIFVVGHPNSAVRDTMAACGARPLPLSEEAIAILAGEGAPLVRTHVPVSHYGLDVEVPTVGVVATLVTAGALGDDEAYHLARALITGLDEFRAEHPALEALEANRMATDGLFAPLHPGAERYYREAGLLP